jgi:hypothetical protein
MQDPQITQIHLKLVSEPLNHGDRSIHSRISNPPARPAQERNLRNLCNLRILNLFLA